MSSTQCGRPPGIPEPITILPNPILDQIETWTKACSAWNDCTTCTGKVPCRTISDALITHLSHTNVLCRIKITFST